jgi:hypothetical protein
VAAAAKTAALVHEHLSEVTVDARGLETVAVDAGVFEASVSSICFPSRPVTMSQSR